MEYLLIDRLKKEYIESYLTYFSPLIRTVLKVHSLESERHYIQHQLWAQEKGYTFFYCLIDPLINHVVGALEIRNPLQFPGQLYCWLNEAYWGKGYFQESMALVTHDYFIKTDAESFNAHIDKGNIRSYNALKKCGFTDTGIVDGPWGLQHNLVNFRFS